MKSFIIFSLILSLGVSAYADKYVRGYVRSDGTAVSGYYRTDSNSSVYDNYSTKGNYNPYTGQNGTKTYNSYNSNSSSGYRYNSSYYGNSNDN